MEEKAEFVKSVTRPFIVVWGCLLYGICLVKGIEIPVPLAALIVAIIVAYFGERAFMRFKELN